MELLYRCGRCLLLLSHHLPFSSLALPGPVPSPSLDLSSLGAIFYPLLFSMLHAPSPSPVTRLVSVHRKEGSAGGRREDELLTPVRVRLPASQRAKCPPFFPSFLLPSLFAEKGLLSLSSSRVCIYGLLVSNIPRTVLLKRCQQRLTQPQSEWGPDDKTSPCELLKCVE